MERLCLEFEEPGAGTGHAGRPGRASSPAAARLGGAGTRAGRARDPDGVASREHGVPTQRRRERAGGAYRTARSHRPWTACASCCGRSGRSAPNAAQATRWKPGSVPPALSRDNSRRPGTDGTVNWTCRSARRRTGRSSPRRPCLRWPGPACSSAGRGSGGATGGAACCRCGYDLTGNMSGKCSECGQPVEREVPA